MFSLLPCWFLHSKYCESTTYIGPLESKKGSPIIPARNTEIKNCIMFMLSY